MTCSSAWQRKIGSYTKKKILMVRILDFNCVRNFWKKVIVILCFLWFTCFGFYTQIEIDHLFKAIVLTKITYALPVYGASQADLNTIQCFLKRCYKRCYTSELINIYDLLEKCDRRLFTKIKSNVDHPLYALLPEVKESSKRLRSQASQLPRINTECFKNSFFNRLRFKYNLAI